MNALNRYKGIIGIVIVIVIGFFAYSHFFAKPQEAPLSSSDVGSTAAVDQGLIGLLLTLKNIRLDNSLFSNPTYTSLQDFGKDLVPEPVGRTNPFAPLGAISAASQSAAVNSSGAPAIGTPPVVKKK